MRSKVYNFGPFWGPKTYFDLGLVTMRWGGDKLYSQTGSAHDQKQEPPGPAASICSFQGALSKR